MDFINNDGLLGSDPLSPLALGSNTDPLSALGLEAETNTDPDEKEESSGIHKMKNYSSVMSNPLMTSVEMEHHFLPLEEEAVLEHKAFFGNPRNLHTLGLVLKSFSIPYDEGVVIASVGSSTTQLHSGDEVLGAMYVGVEALFDEPSMAESMLHSIFATLDSHSLPGPLVLCNAISHFVDSSIDLSIETAESVEMFVSRDALEAAIEADNQQAIKVEQKNIVAVCMILAALVEVVHGDSIHNMPVILLSHTSREGLLSIPRVRYSWVNLKCNTHIEQFPHGFYLVDFGGSSVQMYFCCTSAGSDLTSTVPDLPPVVPGESEGSEACSSQDGKYIPRSNTGEKRGLTRTNTANNDSGASSLLMLASHSKTVIVPIGKHSGIRNRQEEFIKDMTSGAFGCSKIYLNIMKYIRQTITIHALSYNIAPIVCKVYQTGRARQFHYTGSLEPSVQFLPIHKHMD